MSGELLNRARAEGLLPETAAWPADDGQSRPWPVVLLTGLGAWLAAVPLTILLALLLGPAFQNGPGLCVAGLLVLAAAVLVLRQRGLPLFVEQLALPGLLAGGLALCIGLMRELPDTLVAALMMALAVGIAVAVDRPWLRCLLGAAAGVFAGWALNPVVFGRGDRSLLHAWLSLNALVVVWALVLWVQRRSLMAGRQAAWALRVEDLAAGWLMACLAGLCWRSGQTFLLGGVLGAGGSPWYASAASSPAIAAGSALFALAGAAVALRAWPGLRRLPVLLIAGVLAGLGALMPSLGAALFAAALCACTRRWRQAAAAAVAAAWVIGAFYYRLEWPLAQKAALMAGAGAVLALLSLGLGRGAVSAVTLPGLRGRPALLLLSGLVLTLLLVNASIGQKERLIAEGRPVFVPLAPVDPRSLMQGDYMRLNFVLPPRTEQPALLQMPGADRPRVVARLDARGVAQPYRMEEPGEPPAADELPIELTPRDGRWVLVTDAWFFREGDAERYAAARFGEFRVLPDGRALLVGLADASLRPIRP